MFAQYIAHLRYALKKKSAMGAKCNYSCLVPHYTENSQPHRSIPFFLYSPISLRASWSKVATLSAVGITASSARKYQYVKTAGFDSFDSFYKAPQSICSRIEGSVASRGWFAQRAILVQRPATCLPFHACSQLVRDNTQHEADTFSMSGCINTVRLFSENITL